MRYCGRDFSAADIESIRALIAEHSRANRARLSVSVRLDPRHRLFTVISVRHTRLRTQTRRCSDAHITTERYEAA